MNLLKPVSQSQFSTTLLQFFAMKTMGLIAPLTESDAYLQNQKVAIEGATSAIDTLLAHSKVNEKTAELAEEDDVQDEILIGIRDYLKGIIGLRQFDAVKADASEKILQKMNSYGADLLYGGYEKQAALVPSFLNSMKEPLFATAIELVGIGHLIEGLTTSHDKVTVLYQEKLKATVKPDTTMREEKKIIRYRLDLLLSYIEGNLADGVSAFTALEDPMNELITDVMSQYRAQQTRKENKAN